MKQSTYQKPQRMIEKWFDVQDEEGVWRVGYLIKQDKQNAIKLIALDGFHPNYNAYYCKDSEKILPIRTNTQGLTTPQNVSILRVPSQIKQLLHLQGKLKLYILQDNYNTWQAPFVRSFIRTQILMLIDRIFTTPYPIFQAMKTADVQIYKIFVMIINFYYKMIDLSKKFMVNYDQGEKNNQKELYQSFYELTLTMELVLGIHVHSKPFFSHEKNQVIKDKAMFDYLIKSEGILPFKLLLKNLSLISNPTAHNMQLSMHIITFIINLFEKYQDAFVDKQFKAQGSLVIDEIISHLKDYMTKNDQLRQILKQNYSFLSRVQSIFSKLKSQKRCTLRDFVEDRRDNQMTLDFFKSEKMMIESSPMISSEEINNQNSTIKKLEERLLKLETIISKSSSQDNTVKLQKYKPKQQGSKIPMENLGQEMFLASLEWALQSGDISTAKKLTKWRRQLLQLGRITGWQVALTVGCRTYQKCQIDHQDIIEANYEYIMKHTQENVPNNSKK